MKTTTKNDKLANKAGAVTKAENNFYYVVNLEIRHFDEKSKCTMLRDEQTPFKMKNSAIDNRRDAFNFAYQLLQDANIDGKLCPYHLDSPDEGFAKGMKNITALSVEIDCVDEKSGDRVTISEGDFFNEPEDTLDDCEAELMWYKNNGYNTGGLEISVEDEFGDEHSILDYGIVEILES